MKRSKPTNTAKWFGLLFSTFLSLNRHPKAPLKRYQTQNAQRNTKDTTMHAPLYPCADRDTRCVHLEITYERQISVSAQIDILGNWYYTWIMTAHFFFKFDVFLCVFFLAEIDTKEQEFVWKIEWLKQNSENILAFLFEK